MKKIDKGFILPSAALTVKRNQVKYHVLSDKPPEIGNIVYGRIVLLNLTHFHGGLKMAKKKVAVKKIAKKKVVKKKVVKKKK